MRKIPDEEIYTPYISPYPDSTGKVLILTTQLTILSGDRNRDQMLPSKAAFNFPLITFLESVYRFF